MTHLTRTGNIDPETVEGFGEEWGTYTQEGLSSAEHRQLFDEYFSIFPFSELPPDAEGFDLGCGTGRWAALVAEQVGHLHCIEPAARALEVARRRLTDRPNVTFHHGGVDEIPVGDNSQDFGYALGVLHHIPDTEAAMAACVRKLKTGAPLLVYIYYAFENRPAWFRPLWKVTEVGRRIISRAPFPVRKYSTTLIAGLVYYPLARGALLLERIGGNVENLPLSAYRNRSFYSMRTDALDRFGTRLEQRFTRAEIEAMMMRCGLEAIEFRDSVPYWVACGRRSAGVPGRASPALRRSKRYDW
ncbi:MAG: class I SAM-dependent methyltransferase [Sphingomicrobium sp.]